MFKQIETRRENQVMKNVNIVLLIHSKINTNMLNLQHAKINLVIDSSFKNA